MGISEVEISESIDEESISKRLKSDLTNNVKQEIKVDSPKVKSERCIRCKQYPEDVSLYNGHPNNSNEEFIALTDEKLSLYTGQEETFDDNEDLPLHKVTHFSVYDDKGHLCPFDTGLIERNVELFFSGYIKPVYDEDPSTNNGIPAHDMGPINEWWTAGYDGGEKLPIGFSTGYAEYYLMEPSPEYEPFYNKVQEKVKLTKTVIEFLIDKSWENPTYEDLLQHVETIGEFTQIEDILLQNAQFLCDQVLNFDKSSTDDEKQMITLPCMRSLVNMAGVTFQKRKKMRKTEGKGIKVKKAPSWSKAMTTKLVNDVFENFFTDQIHKQAKDEKAPKKKRCGVCEACMSPDCGECSHCKDMLKFGGSGRSKQACKTRRCPNMAILAAELSDNEEEVDAKQETATKKKSCSKRILHKVSWSEKSTVEFKGRKCYSSALVGDVLVKPGDYVVLNSETPNEPLCVAQIAYMYEQFPQGAMFHAHLFCRGTDTILGEASDPRELFVVDVCEDCPLGSIVRKAEVEFREISPNWKDLGGEENLLPQLEDDGQTFFYTKRYDSAKSRFLDYVDQKTDSEYPCISCKRKSDEKSFNTPSFNDGNVKWKNDLYKVGSGVFLDPGAYRFKNASIKSEPSDEQKENNVDPVLYPEFYRKSDTIKGSNEDTPEPFTIGLIEEINEAKKDIKITVRIFYRPDNTISSFFLSHSKDLNFLYWTEEVITTSFENVTGKCYIAFGDNIDSLDEWTQKGPYRFYFTETYDPRTHAHDEVPMAAKRIGMMRKGGGKGKSKSTKSERNLPEVLPVWEPFASPLRCMDVFAGCGGLSEGLHQSGIAETKWAIEMEPAAAQAFRLNNPNCRVFTDDCNDLLRAVFNDEGKERGMPCKGEVEMLVGGPPCQGFSGMNRFNAGQYSAFKNSLVVSYLSYCDYYRPKYFVLENVRNFVSFKRSIVLKLTLRCLLAMGYQVTFGILQAGNYGIPQTRRRLILMAAAPGYALPRYPEPQHVFNRRGCQVTFAVDGNRFHNGTEWTESAPYRTICVRDAMSDLPDIKNGWSKPEIPYDGDAISHFQKMMRANDQNIVKDHVCKEMSAIVEGRISQIPTYPGADWRDLPNISIKLSDGTTTNILRYPYKTKRQKSGEPPRGVCQCATGGPCDPADRQFNTIIPWCLPHTADRHNNWAALYGRLEWDGFFGTTITNPEPMGKQGRVLHPEQNRVVSVRECARSQGFPDRFKFHGNILDKHRQVGNAVPPPLGAALGREIRKAFLKTLNNIKNEASDT